MINKGLPESLQDNKLRESITFLLNAFLIIIIQMNPVADW